MNIRPRSQGFTLIELLVATAVLTLIILLVAELIQQSSRVIRDDTRRMDAFTVARIVLDRVGMDWEDRIRLHGEGYFVEKKPGDDSLFLYSQSPAYSGTRGIATALGYRISPHPEWGRALERAALGYNWSASDPTPDNNPLLLVAANPPALAETDFEAVGRGIIRFETAFLVRDSTTGDVAWRATAPASSADLRAVGLYVVTMDTFQLALLGESATERAAKVGALGAAFADAADSVDTALAWQAVLNDPASLSQETGVPLVIPQSLRTFQRILPIR